MKCGQATRIFAFLGCILLHFRGLPAHATSVICARILQSSSELEIALRQIDPLQHLSTSFSATRQSWTDVDLTQNIASAIHTLRKYKSPFSRPSTSEQLSLLKRAVSLKNNSAKSFRETGLVSAYTGTTASLKIAAITSSDLKLLDLIRDSLQQIVIIAMMEGMGRISIDQSVERDLDAVMVDLLSDYLRIHGVSHQIFLLDPRSGLIGLSLDSPAANDSENYTLGAGVTQRLASSSLSSGTRILVPQQILSIWRTNGPQTDVATIEKQWMSIDRALTQSKVRVLSRLKKDLENQRQSIETSSESNRYIVRATIRELTRMSDQLQSTEVSLVLPPQPRPLSINGVFLPKGHYLLSFRDLKTGRQAFRSISPSDLQNQNKDRRDSK